MAMQPSAFDRSDECRGGGRSGVAQHRTAEFAGFSSLNCYAGLMRFIFLLCTVALVACAPNTTGSSGDSPAERLYAQAANVLSENYNGYSKLDLAAALEKYRARVAQTCAGAKSCKFEVARTALNGLLEELNDPHSYFETPEEFEASQRTQNGLGAAQPRLGVNWVYREASNAWLIVDTTAGLPAQAAGLTRGDLVTALNGAALPKGAEASNALLGNTIRSAKPFTLTVKRAGVAREVNVQGKLVNVAPLPYQRRTAGLPNGTVVIRIPEFSPPTVARDFHKLVAANPNASAIIVDLRGNPGGRATECLAAAGAFVPRLELTFASRSDANIYRYAEGRVTINNRTIYAIQPLADFKGKVAVLVNQDSASCSEIMSALLQTTKRAIIVGEPTYGILNTGTNDFELLDGSGLTVTTIRTLDTSGKPYPDRVTPNVAQKDDLDALEKNAKDVMLEVAVKALQNADTTMTRAAPVRPVQPSSLLELQRVARGQ